MYGLLNGILIPIDQLLLITMIPAMINTVPIILAIVIGSLSSIPLNTRTSTNARLIKGYAKLISNLVIAAIQKSEATKADKNPKKMNGSNRRFNKKTICH